MPPGFPLPPGIHRADGAGGYASTSPAVGVVRQTRRRLPEFPCPGGPPVTVGPLYAAKTIDQCIPADPGVTPTGNDNAAHGVYIADGMTDQAAGFAARLVASKTIGKAHVELSGQHGAAALAAIWSQVSCPPGASGSSLRWSS